MIARRCSILMAALVGIGLVAGCADQSFDTKQKIAELEKRVANQEKQFAEFAGKFGAPRDFSADVQRLEDQQDRLAQQFKTKVDPINMKLEEFREWAQEAQSERDKVAERLKAFDQAVQSLQQRVETESGPAGRLGKQLAENTKKVKEHSKMLQDVAAGLTHLRQELMDNNTKLVAAVKKTLPKVKEAAVEEVKGRIDPLEKTLLTLKTSLETDRKAIESIKGRSPIEAEKDLQALRKKIDELGSGKDVQALQRKIMDLEEVMASHKSFLLEVGSKLHELETAVRGGRAGANPQSSGYTRR
ncbi:MAG: hypothetical protein LDL33_15980 [Desulfomonile sp.]|nr:hypothetical protein [Desulfomonile sp.]